MPELWQELRTCPTFDRGNYLLGFLWTENERKKTGEDEKSEGGGGRKKGEGLPAKFELVRPRTLRCGLCPLTRGPQGNNSFKYVIFKLQNYYPLQEIKIAISKWLTYLEGTFWYAKSNMRRRQTSFKFGRQLLFLNGGGGGGGAVPPPPASPPKRIPITRVAHGGG